MELFFSVTEASNGLQEGNEHAKTTRPPTDGTVRGRNTTLLNWNQSQFKSQIAVQTEFNVFKLSFIHLSYVKYLDELQFTAET